MPKPLNPNPYLLGTVLSGNFGPTGGSVSIGPNRAALTTNTGITVNTAGVLNQRVAVPVDPVAGTAYAIGFPQGNVETRELTVGGVIFEGRIYFTGGNFISPIPIELKGFLPKNGENAVSSFMSVRWGPGNNGRSARLRVTYGNGFVLDQTQTIAASKALFANFSTDSSNVPATGVQLVEFLIGDL